MSVVSRLGVRASRADDTRSSDVRTRLGKMQTARPPAGETEYYSY